MWREARAAGCLPVRAYHSLVHLAGVLAPFDAVASGPGWQRPLEGLARDNLRRVLTGG